MSQGGKIDNRRKKTCSKAIFALRYMPPGEKSLASNGLRVPLLILVGNKENKESTKQNNETITQNIICGGGGGTGVLFNSHPPRGNPPGNRGVWAGPLFHLACPNMAKNGQNSASGVSQGQWGYPWGGGGSPTDPATSTSSPPPGSQKLNK